MKKIVVFNHKGGVSKTTNTFHIGWKLADLGKRVLLVDGDPQCNLTSLFLGDKFDSYYEDEVTEHKNIKDGVAAVFSGQPIAIEPFECPTAERNGNLYLLPGHMNLSEYEGSLNFALNATTALPSLKSLPGAFNELIGKIANKHSIDYVLIDLNPALSSINQVLFLSADAFLIPVNPDIFAMMALKSLSVILPNWSEWSNRCRSMFTGAAYMLPDSPPRFLGVLSQRFNIRNGVPTTPYRNRIESINELVNSTLIPAFHKADMLFPDDRYEAVGLSDSKEIMQIKDFQGLSPKSQKWNVPVFSLEDQELDATGAALAGMQANRELFNEMYTEVSEKIIMLLS
jgi:regulatory protein CII